jgi:hypothetical protein
MVLGMFALDVFLEDGEVDVVSTDTSDDRGLVKPLLLLLATMTFGVYRVKQKS